MATTTTHINRKCAGCGLVNFAAAPECRRCRAPLGVPAADAVRRGAPPAAAEAFRAPAGWPEPFEEEARPRRRLRARVAWVLGTTFAVFVAFYASLLLSADAPSMAQRLQVREAVALVERGGFERETFLLRRVTAFRTSANWLNRAVSHGPAYASTNYPFEVVTLYPPFFDKTADATERAVVLLHEARHLRGDDEREAHGFVWREKARLGWTRERYGHTRLWHNAEELTRRHAPELFTCGRDGKRDCAE